MLTIPPITIANTMPDLVSRVQQVIDALNANTVLIDANNALNLGGQPPSFYTNATNITTGTLADTQLSSNVPLKNANNIFSTVQQIANAQPRLLFSETDQGTDLKNWDAIAESGVFSFRTLTDAGAGTLNVLSMQRAGDVSLSNGSLSATRLRPEVLLKHTGDPSRFTHLQALTPNQVLLAQNLSHNGTTFVQDNGTVSSWYLIMANSAEGDVAVIGRSAPGGVLSNLVTVTTAGIADSSLTAVAQRQILRPIGRLQRSASLSIGNLTGTFVTWDVEATDTSAMITGAGATSIFYPVNGFYLVEANIIWDNVNAGGGREMRLYVDGTTILSRHSQPGQFDPNGVLAGGMSTSVVTFGTAGSSAAVWVVQNTGAPVNIIGGHFSVTLLRESNNVVI